MLDRTSPLMLLRLPRIVSTFSATIIKLIIEEPMRGEAVGSALMDAK